MFQDTARCFKISQNASGCVGISRSVEILGDFPPANFVRRYSGGHKHHNQPGRAAAATPPDRLSALREVARDSPRGSSYPFFVSLEFA